MIRQGGLGKNGAAGLITDQFSPRTEWMEGLEELSVGWGGVGGTL